MSWREVAQAVFERSGRSRDDVTGTTTEAYAEGVLAQGRPFAPRPLGSAMSLDKIRATGFEPEDAIAALAGQSYEELVTWMVNDASVDR